MGDRGGIRLDRLGVGEWLNGIGSVALLVVLFALPWYGSRTPFEGALGHGSPALSAAFGRYRANGWETFGVIGPLALAVGVLGIGVWLLCATRRSPVVPVALTVVQAPLSGALVVALAVRVLFDQPQVLLAGPRGANALQTLAGAYVGLGLSIAVAAGIYGSLRREGVAAADAPLEIETLEVSETPSGGHA